MAIVESSTPHHWRTQFEGLFEVPMVAPGVHHLVHKVEEKLVASSTPRYWFPHIEEVFVMLLVLFVSRVLVHVAQEGTLKPVTCQLQ